MQSFEDAPPPYPGTAPNVVTSKGDYRGVPVYEVGTSSAPVCKSYLPVRRSHSRNNPVFF